MDTKIAPLPEGVDPADAIGKDPAIWKDALRQSKPAIEFFLAKILDGEKDERKWGKLAKVRILPLVALIPTQMERSNFVTLVSRMIGMKAEMVWEALKEVKLPTFEKEAPAEDEKRKKITGPSLPRKTGIERRLVGIIFWQEALPMPAIDVSSLKSQIVALTSADYLKNLIEGLEIEKENLVFEAESYYGDPERLPKDLVELLDNFTDDLLREDLSRHIRDLYFAEAKKDEQAKEMLSQEIQAIHGKMRALEEKRKVL